jgi:BCD family chlorophyll transporter-like MFS transporter
MPFALLVLSGEGQAPAEVGQLGAALAFLLVGAGIHTTQTAGLALATDLCPAAVRPRVVALLYVMLLVGMVASSLVFGVLLADFGPQRLVQVIQGAAVVTMALNVVALWKQEARQPAVSLKDRADPQFAAAWREFIAANRPRRFLVAVGLGTAGFSMQDILLEPYGAQVLGLGVGATTLLTALAAFGTLVAFALAARTLQRGGDPCRLAAHGALVGIFAFAAVILAGPLDAPLLFRTGTVLIGFGTGLFSVGTLTGAMALGPGNRNGLALGAWGATQATAAGVGIALGGAIRDMVGMLSNQGLLGSAFEGPAPGYAVVYHIEIALLFAALVAIGPLVRVSVRRREDSPRAFGLAEFPG